MSSLINFGRRSQLVIYTPIVDAETQAPVVNPDKTSSTIATPVYYDGYVLNDLDFSCSIEYTMSERNNNDRAIQLRIKGLPISSELIKVGVRIDINAGYNSHGETALTTFYSGIVTDFSFQGNQGVGSSVTVTMLANASVSQVAKISTSYPSGTSLRVVADSVSEVLGAPITMSPTLEAVTLVEPLIFYGNALDEFGDFLNFMRYSITYNVSGYYVTTTSSKSEPFDLYSVFEPSVEQVLSGLSRAGSKGQTVAKDGSSSGNLKLTLLLKYIPPLSVINLSEAFGDFAGSYIVDAMTYKLDTAGNDWYTLLELKLRPDTQL